MTHEIHTWYDQEKQETMHSMTLDGKTHPAHLIGVSDFEITEIIATGEDILGGPGFSGPGFGRFRGLGLVRELDPYRLLLFATEELTDEMLKSELVEARPDSYTRKGFGFHLTNEGTRKLLDTFDPYGKYHEKDRDPRLGIVIHTKVSRPAATPSSFGPRLAKVKAETAKCSRSWVQPPGWPSPTSDPIADINEMARKIKAFYGFTPPPMISKTPIAHYFHGGGGTYPIGPGMTIEWRDEAPRNADSIGIEIAGASPLPPTPPTPMERARETFKKAKDAHRAGMKKIRGRDHY